MSEQLAPVDLDELERRLAVPFRDRGLLLRAVTHRSYAFEQGGLSTNERLEFLGDAVLGLIVTDTIFHAHPDQPEGTLAKLRAAAVKSTSLAHVARELGLGAFVLLGKGEAASGGADKDSILADTLEAVLGAIYLDRGLDAVSEAVHRLFDDRLNRLAARGAALDYKTSLQELAASRYETLPHYDVNDEGPDHEKTFTASVRVAGRRLGSGVGRSKKEAEQAAAREAYLRLTEEVRPLTTTEEEPRARTP